MGVKLREGFFRRVENNVIMNGFGGFHVWFPGCDDVIARNIFVSEKPYQFIRANPEYAKEFDYNLFYCDEDTPTITGVGDPMTFEEWKGKGFDTHSLFADPLFIDPSNGNYQVKFDSPAIKLGFKNFPMNRFGVLKPEFQIEAAKESCAFQPAPTIQETSPSSESFTWMGAKVKNLTTEAEMSAAGIGRKSGVLFLEIPPESPAAQTGFQSGDVLLKVGRTEIHTIRDLRQAIKENVGNTVPVTIHNAVERIVRMEITQSKAHPANYPQD